MTPPYLLLVTLALRVGVAMLLRCLRYAPADCLDLHFFGKKMHLETRVQKSPNLSGFDERFEMTDQIMGDEIDASFKNRRHNAPNLLD